MSTNWAEQFNRSSPTNQTNVKKTQERGTHTFSPLLPRRINTIRANIRFQSDTSRYTNANERSIDTTLVLVTGPLRRASVC